MAAARKKITHHKKTTQRPVVKKTEEKFEKPQVEETSVPMQSVPMSSPVPPVSNPAIPEQPAVSVTPQTPSPSPTPVPAPAPTAAQPAAPPAPQQPSDPLADFKEKLHQETEVTPAEPPKKNFFLPIIFIVLLAFAALGGVFLYKQSMENKPQNVNVVTLSPTPTQIPTPTVEEVDLTAYEIKVLNGSETAGEAGRLQENLEEEGFVVSEIGNAEESDYEETVIQAKEEVEKAFLEKLREVLEESFAVAKEIGELPQDADSDIIIIIGSETN